MTLVPGSAPAIAPLPAAPAGPSAAGPAALGARDIETVARFLDTHLAVDAAFMPGVRRQDRIADLANDLVGQALDAVGNDMPEDIRSAVNVIMIAAPILDAPPRPGTDPQRYLADLKAVEALLERGAASIASGGQSGEEAALRRDTARLLHQLKAEMANTHRYRANQLPPPCTFAAAGAETLRDTMDRGRQFLRMTPADPADAGALLDEMDDILARLPDPRAEGSANPDAAFEARHPDVAALRGNIARRMGILRENMALNPLSQKSVFDAKAHAVLAAIGVIDGVLRSERPGGKRDALDRAKAALSARIDLMRTRTDLATQTKEAIRDIMGGAGKYRHRPTEEVAGADPELAAGIDALVDDVLRAPDDSGDDSASPPAADGGETTPLVPRTAGGLPLFSAVAREEHIMTAFLDRLFTKLDIDPGCKLSKLYRKSIVDVRDSRDWTRISRPVQLVRGEQVHNLTSEIARPPGLTWVNCHQSSDTEHATNLLATRLTDESGAELFSAVRHGTLSAYEISSDELRQMDAGALKATVSRLFPTREALDMLRAGKASPGDAAPKPAPAPGDDPDFAAALDEIAARIANERRFRDHCAHEIKNTAAIVRAREVVTAAAISRADAIRVLPDGAKEMTFDINSVSLLSPDTPSRLLGFFHQLRGKSTGGKDEHAMLENQYHAWHAINRAGGDGIALDLPGHGAVTVKVKVNAFNFGVNDIEHFFVSSSDWGRTRRENEAAMRGLIGDLAGDAAAPLGGQVGAWLRDNPFAGEATEALARQVADLWHSRAFNNPGFEPYKLVSRITVLSHMIGAGAAFNCKSGKDRTGALEVEAKYLASFIAATGKVPQPDTDRSAEERGNFYRLLMEGGNLEAQKWNTGFAGLKQKPFAFLTPIRRQLESITLGSDGNGKRDIRHISIRAAQGLSSFVGS